MSVLSRLSRTLAPRRLRTEGRYRTFSASAPPQRQIDVRAGARAHPPVPELADLSRSFPMITESIAGELSGRHVPLALAEAEWVQSAGNAGAGVPRVVADRVPLADTVLPEANVVLG